MEGSINVMLIGPPGSGKTRSLFNVPADKMILIDADFKPPSFKTNQELKIVQTTDMQKILQIFEHVRKSPTQKIVVLDTVNSFMNDMELLEKKKTGYGKWMELATDVYEMMRVSARIPGNHIFLYTFHSDEGVGTMENKERAKTNGRKLEKICLEGLCSVVLYSRSKENESGEMEFLFEVWPHPSHTAKSPEGMFSSRFIPNDFSLVAKAVNDYYGIKS
jgi:hypothetical protein